MRKQNDELNATKKSNVICLTTKNKKICKYWSLLNASFSHEQ